VKSIELIFHLFQLTLTYCFVYKLIRKWNIELNYNFISKCTEQKSLKTRISLKFWNHHVLHLCSIRKVQFLFCPPPVLMHLWSIVHCIKIKFYYQIRFTVITFLNFLICLICIINLIATDIFQNYFDFDKPIELLT